jgi:hypothetical protein
VIFINFNFSTGSCSHNFWHSDVKIGMQYPNLPSNKFIRLDFSYWRTHEKWSIFIVKKREVKNIFSSKCIFTAGVQSQNGLESFIVVLIVEVNCCTSHHAQMHWFSWFFVLYFTSKCSQNVSLSRRSVKIECLDQNLMRNMMQCLDFKSNFHNCSQNHFFLQ